MKIFLNLLIVPCLLCATTVDTTDHLKLIVPRKALSSESVQIIQHDKNFPWTKQETIELHHLIHKIIKIWEKEGTSDYFVYGKKTPEIPASGYHLVPFKDQSYYDQFHLLTRIFLGVSWHSNSKQEQNELAERLKKQLPVHLSRPNVHPTPSNDPFCNPDILKKQVLYEGTSTYLLLDYAAFALAEERLHFLIIPKKHKERFSDLSIEEFIEAHQIANALFTHFSDQYPAYMTHLIHKSGRLAMQDVPHWHLHVIFGPNNVPNFGKKSELFWRFIFKDILSKEELRSRVESLFEELNEPKSLFQATLKNFAENS